MLVGLVRMQPYVGIRERRPRIIKGAGMPSVVHGCRRRRLKTLFGTRPPKAAASGSQADGGPGREISSDAYSTQSPAPCRLARYECCELFSILFWSRPPHKCISSVYRLIGLRRANSGTAHASAALRSIVPICGCSSPHRPYFARNACVP